jgi:hypothetical protein
LNDQSWAYLQNLLDTFVLNKLNTASGEERSSWNRQALQSFFDSFGFGVGNGSARASSFLIAVLASLGLIGTPLFVTFMIGVFRGRRTSADPLSPALQLGAKSTCLAWLISSSISSTQMDLGLSFYLFAAVACARQSQPAASDARSRSWNRDPSPNALSSG